MFKAPVCARVIRRISPLYYRNSGRLRNASSITNLANLLETKKNELTQEESFEFYKIVQRALNIEPCIIRSVVDNRGMSDNLIMLISTNWYRSEEARVWALDALSKLAEDEDYINFNRILLQIIENGLVESEVNVWCRVVNKYHGVLYNTRSGLWKFIELLHNNPEYWAITTDLLIKAALLQGKPILASSIALRLSKHAQHDTVLSILRSMLFDDKVYGKYHLRAARDLTLKFNISLPDNIKTRIIKSVCGMPRDFFELVDECSRFLLKDGKELPLAASHEIILRYLNQKSPIPAAELWRRIERPNIIEHSVHVLSRIIKMFSKFATTRLLAKQIIGKIPKEYYHLDGLTEALLVYCTRKHDYDLAQEVYSCIETPIRRDTLTYLLYLHIRFEDKTGISKIVNEIIERGGQLTIEENAALVRSMAREDLKKAEEYVKSLESIYKNSCYLELAAACVELGKGSFSTFVHKRYGPKTHDQSMMTVNLRIKHHCLKNEIENALFVYKQGKIEGCVNDISRNTILNTILRLKLPLHVKFLRHEYQQVGYSLRQLRALLKQQPYYNEKLDEQFNEFYEPFWMVNSDNKSVNSITP